MDWPDTEDPIMIVISFVGGKMQRLESTGMVGRDGMRR